MIFVLAILVGLTPGARAQMNLDHGALRLRGPFVRTDRPGLLTHPEIDRPIDLNAFGTRTDRVCEVLLGARRTTLLRHLNPTPDLVVDDERPKRRDHSPRRFAAVNVARDHDVLELVAESFRPDRLFVPIKAGDVTPSTRVRLIGTLAERLADLVEVARRYEVRETSAAKDLMAYGLFDEDGDFNVETLSLPVELSYAEPTFITAVRGEIIRVGAEFVIFTPHGRRLKLVAVPAIEGIERFNFFERLDPSIVGPLVEIAGVEIDGTLRVSTRR